MVAGLKFLSKKGFNPQNLKNQKTVWERQQEKQNEEKRIKERQDQLKRERDDEELARARGGQRGGDIATLKFMYDAPPGTSNDNNKQQEEEESGKNVTSERQPGDDDAAAAFRQMLAAASTSNQQQANNTTANTEEAFATTAFSDSSGAALSGTTIDKANKNNEQLSALEKAVGRRDANSSLTLEEQIARFPQLKNAPMAKGMSATNVGVNFKPLGTQLRNCRCFVCGVWGHSKGDRECAMSGWDPFSASSKPSVAVQQDGAVAKQQASDVDAVERKQEDGKKRARNDYASDSVSSSDSEDSRRRRRKRHRKKHKSRKHESKRKRRSYSDDERRSKKSSHKRRKKHSSRHDDD